MRGGGRRDCVIYVGDLPSDVRTREIDDAFHQYGRIRNIDVKGGERGRTFAFVEFEDPRDAMDAVKGRDGSRFFGERMRVEVAKGTAGPPPAPRDWRDKGTGFRIIVEGLPRHASWQDLKDMFRKVETPVYTNVYTDSRGVFGVVEYNSHSELRDVIRELRGSEFKNPFCEPVPVQLIDDTDDSKRDERERDRSPAGKPSRSPPRQRSPARSGTRSLSRSRSRCGLSGVRKFAVDLALWSAVRECPGGRRMWRMWSVGACHCLWTLRQLFPGLGRTD